MAEATGDTSREALARIIFDRRFLISRPLLQALEPHAGGAPVLLIDELDRTDEPFEAFLLEVLSDYQITIPESARSGRRPRRSPSSPPTAPARSTTP